MKHYLIIFFLLFSNFLYSQCKDVYGVQIDCPTEQDSLVLYNNALKVYDFYDNNKSYEKTRTRELKSDFDKRNIFEDLTTARRLFFVIRREVAKIKETEKKFIAGKTSPKYVDINYKEYYQEVDEYRFYQREIESQIVNKSAPIAIYDNRIAPIIVNEYHCIDSTSPYFGDLVNIPLYIPVTVKPFMLLTESELIIRNDILKKIDPNYIPKNMNKPLIDTMTIRETITKITNTEDNKKRVIIKDTVIKKDNIRIKQPEIQLSCTFPIPVYAFNPMRGGTLVGFVCDKYFIKIKPSQYNYYAVPKWAQDILENKKDLNNLLKNKFGDYLLGVIE